MGAHSAVDWTIVLVVFGLSVATAEHSLLQDLGLNVLPDIAKTNISLDEYTSMMNVYLKTRQTTSDQLDGIPNLVTFNLESRTVREADRLQKQRLRFPISRTQQTVHVESAQLQILLGPQKDTNLQGEVHQVLGTRRRRFLDERTLYLSQNQTKWIEFDVTGAMQSWLDGDRNLGIEMSCSGCTRSLEVRKAAITAVMRSRRRVRRASRTECRSGNKKCCRHDMTVQFAKLRKFKDIVVQPVEYEAGFCQGNCPPNFNYATNHSRIQSLLHQLDRKMAKRSNVKITPKACCAPSKLGPLEILKVNPSDPTKLMVEMWDNMHVIECACS